MLSPYDILVIYSGKIVCPCAHSICHMCLSRCLAHRTVLLWFSPVVHSKLFMVQSENHPDSWGTYSYFRCLVSPCLIRTWYPTYFGQTAEFGRLSDRQWVIFSSIRDATNRVGPVITYCGIRPMRFAENASDYAHIRSRASAAGPSSSFWISSLRPSQALLNDRLRSNIPWLVVWLPSILFSQKYWECQNPNWLSYFSEGWPNHQPVPI